MDSFALWIKNNNKTYNISETRFGNPGLGGTQFEEAIVSFYLKEMYPKMNFKIYTNNMGLTSHNVKIVYVKDIHELLEKVSNSDSILLFTQTDVDSAFYSSLKKTKIQAIAWVHNYLTYDVYNSLVKIENIQKVVFVGQQLYDHYIDTPLIKKSLVIYNCIPDCFVKRDDIVTKKVVYVGALIRQKGFHVLAKAWKGILKECPDAELYAIGGGLYGSENEISDYQKYCNRYLSDSKGELLPSVHYLGTLGNEKEEFYKTIKVGVANPTGNTETFCLSAVEFESHGIPVVTYDGYGLLDTVIDGETGYRIRGVKDCKNAVVRLLKDDELNRKLSNQAKKFADSRFTPDIIIPQWYSLLTEKLWIKEMPDSFSYQNFRDDFKFFRFLNRKIMNMLGLKRGISVQGVETFLKYKIKKMLKKN